MQYMIYVFNNGYWVHLAVWTMYYGIYYGLIYIFDTDLLF